jgi:hypothetical protein
MNSDPARLPRNLWMYWHQGLEAAPFVVRRCIESWIALNPGWNVVVLDSGSVGDYIEVELSPKKREKLSVNHLSNLIRLALLDKYGGVWTDATTFCVRPLDEWIDALVPSGFFVFSNPGEDRLISNWFIAAKAGNPILRKLYERQIMFWEKHLTDKPARRRDRKRQRDRHRMLWFLLSRSTRTTRFWLSPIVSKVLRVYPYFLFHYQFERLVSTDAECGDIWRRMPKVPADGPRAPRIHGYLAPPDKAIKEHIRERRAPFYKLTWKFDPQEYSADTTLYHLLEGREDRSR